MRIPKRKSQLQRLRGTVSEAPKKVNLPGDKTVKTGLLVAGGLAALTWVSAGISSMRRQGEESDAQS